MTQPFLKALAVSCPHHRGNESYGPGELTSRTPVSLHNMLRGAMSAVNNRDSYWSKSNFMTGDTTAARADRRSKTFFAPTMNHLDAFKQKLRDEKPNLLLLGAMTLSYRGAVEFAKRAREILGNEVVIVLGGRHANESIYKPRMGSVFHQASSPILHMQQHKIPASCFDLVVSGIAEDLVRELGEIVGGLQEREGSVLRFKDFLAPLLSARGAWIASYIDKSGQIKNIEGDKREIDFNVLPPAVEAFGINEYGFSDVFGPDAVTAHVFSRSGLGCAKNCSFCGERREIAGAPEDMASTAHRVHQELKSAARVLAEDYPAKKPSAFCEDSIFLFGNTDQIKKFCELAERDPVGIEFGLQMTIDTIRANRDILPRLHNAGARYVYFGLETVDEDIAGTMSKNAIGANWKERALEAARILHQNGFKIGSSIIFGLGEKPESRADMFRFLKQVSDETGGALCTVSQNIGTRHPNRDPGVHATFLEWGIPALPKEESGVLKNFGEATLAYQIAPVSIPEMSAIVRDRQMILGM